MEINKRRRTRRFLTFKELNSSLGNVAMFLFQVRLRLFRLQGATTGIKSIIVMEKKWDRINL